MLLAARRRQAWLLHRFAIQMGPKSHQYSRWRSTVSRAVIYETFGGPGVLELREVPEPHAGLGELRVRVAAVGLNAMDPAFAAMPELAARFDITLPSGFGFGYDFAGRVDEIGEGISEFALGDASMAV
jgi:NADPH:quinone reductase-like Zn-dependent oxidoreductase